MIKIIIEPGAFFICSVRKPIEGESLIGKCLLRPKNSIRKLRFFSGSEPQTSHYIGDYNEGLPIKNIFYVNWMFRIGVYYFKQ